MIGYNKKGIYPGKKVLSSTQFLDYEQSPQKFYARWVMGINGKETESMRIGRAFAELYATRKESVYREMRWGGMSKRIIELFRRVLPMFPVLKRNQVEVPLICKYRGWGFRATLDGFIKEKRVIIENKTGKTEWTQDRADRSDQITFQAWVHWKKTGKLPAILVNWINTNSNAIQPLVSFQTSRSIEALKYFEKRVDKVIESLNQRNFTQPLY